MIKLGATTIPLAGWGVDPRRPEEARGRRLAAIHQLVTQYGLSAVELSLDLGVLFPQVFDASFYEAVAELQQEIGFACTVHFPFLWVDPSSANELVRRASAESVRRAVELTRPLEVTTYVLHLWGFTTIQIARLLTDPIQRQVVLAETMLQMERSLEEAGAVVNPSDLCVENLEAPPFDAVLPLIDRYGASICLDVGHLAYSDDDPFEFLARHGDRVREVHLHDFVITVAGKRRQVQDHLPLGRGQFDHTSFLRQLEEMGFEGVVILEVNSRPDLEESLEQVGPLF